MFVAGLPALHLSGGRHAGSPRHSVGAPSGPNVRVASRVLYALGGRAPAGHRRSHLVTRTTASDEVPPRMRRPAPRPTPVPGHLRSLAPPARPVRVCIAATAMVMIVLMTQRPGDRPTDGAAGQAAPADARLAAAVDTTRAVTSARVELQTALVGPSGPVVLVHRAAFADGGLRARGESDMSQVAEALAAAGQDLDGDWSHPAGIVIDGDTVYSQLGPMAEALGRAPDDWARAQLSDVAAPDGAADNDTLALVLDPLGPLDLLRRPVARVEVVGDDDVRGTRTEHLRATLDLAGEGGDGAPVGSFEARLVAAGVETLPVEVWLDGDDVVRRLQVTLDAGGSGAGSLSTTFDVFDVGAEVDVAIPDRADVISP